MAYRKTISVNEEINKIIDSAAGLWPELAHNQSALICKIIADWDRIRTNGGGRMQQINTRLDKHEMYLMLICQRLGIDYVAPLGEDEVKRHVPT